MSIHISISYGELIDKITILEIKFERIDDEAKRQNIERELASLTDAWLRAGVDISTVASEQERLKSINESLWEIEDEIRKKESQKSFDEKFVQLARSVYRTNDERASVKRVINEKLGSTFIEEKSYQPY